MAPLADEDTPGEAAEALADAAYEHAVRGLDSQAAVLAETRVRGNYIIVATVGVATLFAGFLLRSPSPEPGIEVGALLPLVVLALGVSFAVRVLCPTGKQGAKGELEFVASATAILALDGSTAIEARGHTARALEAMWDHNQPVIERLMQRLRWAATCLAAQVGCWTILLVLKQVL